MVVRRLVIWRALEFIFVNYLGFLSAKVGGRISYIGLIFLVINVADCIWILWRRGIYRVIIAEDFVEILPDVRFIVFD